MLMLNCLFNGVEDLFLSQSCCTHYSP